MSVTGAIRRMLDAGLTLEQALLAAESFEAESTPTCTARQERNKRYYAKKASEKRLKPSEQDISDDQDDISSPDKKEPPTPQEKTNPNSQPPSPPKGGSSPTDRAFETFSEAAKTCRVPIPRSLTADRRRKIEARLREHGEGAWQEACQKLASSPFCNGSNDRGWIADLDFICQPKSFNRLIEGGYDAPDPQARGSPRHETDLQRISRQLRERQDDQRRTDFEFDGPVIQGFPG